VVLIWEPLDVRPSFAGSLYTRGLVKGKCLRPYGGNPTVRNSSRNRGSDRSDSSLGSAFKSATQPERASYAFRMQATALFLSPNIA
jgi:hypothetical protein